MSFYCPWQKQANFRVDQSQCSCWSTTQKLFSAEEIAESGLAARVVEAQEKAIQAVERAADSFREFGVPREVFGDLLDVQVALQAKAIKAAMGKRRRVSA
jgi:enoyl-CoA hydratase/carnithine racemase